MKFKKIVYTKPDFSKRFSNAYRGHKILSLSKSLKDNLIVSNQLSTINFPISSINYNNWLLDTKSNFETLFINTNNIKQYLNSSISKYCLSILNEAKSYEDILVAYQNKKYNNIFNYFLKPLVISNKLEDPLTKVILDEKYKAHYCAGAGYSPAIKDKTIIPISSIERDFQNSVLGHILDEYYINNTNENGYKLLFELIKYDNRNNYLNYENNLVLQLNINILGIQNINNITIRSFDNIYITNIYYIDSNQLLNALSDFDIVTNNGITTISFQEIIASSLRLEFKILNFVDQISTKIKDSQVYSFYVKDISLSYINYQHISYIDTSWILKNNLGSLKIEQKMFSSSDDFLIENFLIIDSIKEKQIYRISENYNDWIFGSVYFVNNKAELFGLPKELELYKNGSLLNESVDYYIYTSLSSDPTTIASLDITKPQYINLYISNFDPTAFYYIKYKVHNNIINIASEFYNQDYIIFSKKNALTKIKFITCFRKKTSKITKVPIIKSLFVRTTNVTE